MPLLHTRSSESYIAGLWQISEPVEVLAEACQLTPDDTVLYESFCSERRKREFLATRRLLESLSNGNYRLHYDNTGRPLLSDFDKQVSVSHSASLVAVLICDVSCGIDVEEIERNVDRVSTRFLSPEEQHWINLVADSRMTRLICWSAKEAVFKMMRVHDVDFSLHIRIFPFKDRKSVV